MKVRRYGRHVERPAFEISVEDFLFRKEREAARFQLAVDRQRISTLGTTWTEKTEAEKRRDPKADEDYPS